MYSLFSVSRLEVKNMLRNPIYWLGWLSTILWAVVWDSPLRAGELWTATRCAYRFGHGVVTLGVFILAILFANAFRMDRVTQSAHVLFTQPLTLFQYALGKFVGIFFINLIPILIGMLCYLLIPLAFGQAPYSPLPFLKVFVIYILPSLFALSSLCYAVVVAFKEFLFAIIIPIILFLLTDESILAIRIHGKLLNALTYEQELTPTLYEALLTNRFITLTLGVCLLSLAILWYCKKKSY